MPHKGTGGIILKLLQVHLGCRFGPHFGAFGGGLVGLGGIGGPFGCFRGFCGGILEAKCLQDRFLVRFWCHLGGQDGTKNRNFWFSFSPRGAPGRSRGDI